MNRNAPKFTALLSGALNNTQAIKRSALVVPTHHIVRGISLEPTSRKNEYYLWRLVLPLYCPILPVLALSYSTRIRMGNVGECLLKLEGDLAELAETTARRLQSLPSYIEISGKFEVGDFLAVCNPEREFLTPAMALDLAISDYLMGEYQRARGLLDDLLMDEKPFFYLHEAKEIARSILAWMDSDPALLDEYIGSSISRNVTKYFPGLVMTAGGAAETMHSVGSL